MGREVGLIIERALALRPRLGPEGFMSHRPTPAERVRLLSAVEEVQACLGWLSRQAYTTRIYRGADSSLYCRIVAAIAGRPISHGAFIVAALGSGLEYEHQGSGVLLKLSAESFHAACEKAWPRLERKAEPARREVSNAHVSPLARERYADGRW